MQRLSASADAERLARLCSLESGDGVLGCSAGPLGRLRWVLRELGDIVRAHRNARAAGHDPSRDATS